MVIKLLYNHSQRPQ